MPREIGTAAEGETKEREGEDCRSVYVGVDVISFFLLCVDTFKGSEREKYQEKVKLQLNGRLRKVEERIVGVCIWEL